MDMLDLTYLCIFVGNMIAINSNISGLLIQKYKGRSEVPRKTLTQHNTQVTYMHFNFRVLVFPPVTDHYRFLIHKAVQESKNNLHSFSIGAGDERRTVVCRPLLLVR